MATREEKKKFLQEYEKTIDEGKCDKILECIESVCDCFLQELLERRYIHLQGWEQIAKELHMGRATAFRYHNKALDAMEMPEE